MLRMTNNTSHPTTQPTFVERQATISADYVAARIDRPTYVERIVELHADITTETGAPCVCMACRETGGSK